MTDSQIDDLLNTLDDIAREFDKDDFGLPLGWVPVREKMYAAVRDWLDGQWISVNDRLPEPGQHVAFVVAPNRDNSPRSGRILGGMYTGELGGFGVPGLGLAATHWRPQFEPPKNVAGSSGP